MFAVDSCFTWFLLLGIGNGPLIFTIGVEYVVMQGSY